MGKILQIALGVVFVSFILILLSQGAYNTSPDNAKSNKTAFANLTFYSKTYNASNTLNCVGGSCNYTYNQTTKPASNLELAATNIMTSIASASNAISIGDLGAAFGNSVKFGYNILVLIFSVLFEGANLVLGIGGIFSNFPSPWNSLAIITSLATTVIIIYMVLKILSAQQKWDM